MSRLSRRTLLKLLGSAASVAVLPAVPGCKPVADSPTPGPRASGALAGLSPIDRTLPDVPAAAWTGDSPARPHGILRNQTRQDYLLSRGGLPQPTEEVPLVVIGGGLSGLTTAWQLRHHRPVVLERAERFGGNARGEAWQGVDYSIGAAYFVKPEPGSPIDALLRELGVRYREREGEDPVALNGRRYDGFWKGETDPQNSGAFRHLASYFRNVLNGDNGQFYPDIPVHDADARERINKLDRVSFMKHLRGVAGGTLHPHIEAKIEHFCWSSFAASASEVSAACGLNFYAAEFDALAVCPGGNAAVAEALLERLAQALPAGHLRPRSVVVDVRMRDQGVQVTWEDADGRLRALQARAAVLACPKFVARKILHEIEPERERAIGRLRYRAYVVANVLLKGPVTGDFFDIFLLGKGRIGGADTAQAAAEQKATDVLLATFARSHRERSVLTLYRAFPFDYARALLEPDASFGTFQREFREQVEREILPLVARSPRDVADIRMARWGHPLPVAQVGLIADGVPEKLRAPFRDRVFFVEQDNWALPAFETAVGEALHFAPQIDRLLKS